MIDKIYSGTQKIVERICIRLGTPRITQKGNKTAINSSNLKETPLKEPH